MAVINLMRGTGFLYLLLLGLLLPASLVSGQNSTVTPMTWSQSTSATQPSFSSSTGATVQSSSVTTSATSQNTAMSESSSMYASSSASTATGGSTNMNGTSVTNSSSDMLYCPSFTCSYSECYAKYSSENATSCSSEYNCQLLRTAYMQYNVSCSSSCAMSCVNSSDTNCSEKCCNSTGCLNGTFASMMPATTASTTTTTRTPQPTAAPTITTNNGNKCEMGTCTGETCYLSFKNKNFETCPTSKPHCQLKKETVNSAVQWTAGCANCTGSAACTASTQPPCHLECCIASKTSCLMLNGTLNVSSFAIRGPHTQLITYLLCMTSSAVLFFIL